VDVHFLAYNMQDNPEIDLIDVRTPEEYTSGHIAGTMNVSLDSLSEAVRGGILKPDKPLAVVCARGGRSAQACVRLSKVFGFPDVTNVTGGMQAWIAADLPVVVSNGHSAAESL
jgi:rhodanese-related sulfurtransferase